MSYLSAGSQTHLRVATAGSVDDGKSTLLGRLLHDSRSLHDDAIAAVNRATTARGGGQEGPDLSLITDGLRAEREQGITIDVAYRYFSTPRRSFVLADTPGHVQYTRNTVTGASTADVAVVLVDVRNGVAEQTRRHAAVMALLRVPHVVFCLNKVDLVGWDAAVVKGVEQDVRALADAVGLTDIAVIPVSALRGDNVVERSTQMPFYDGPSLLEHLEEVEVQADPCGEERARFPVQYVIRPRTEEHHDYRGYAGRVTSGCLRPGDEVVVLPSGRRTAVAGIDTADGPVPTAVAGMSVTLLLADDLDVGRGDVVAAADDPPTVTADLEADVCWMADEPLTEGRRLLVRHTTREVLGIVRGVGPRLDVGTGVHEPADALTLNDLGRVRLRVATPLPVDPYALDRATGCLLLIDAESGATLGAGMLR